MSKKMTDRDITAISAYLDGELNARESARMEARLKADPQLLAQVKQLENVRALLRGLPEIRAPRNFTLRPEMAGVRPQPSRLFPTLRFASALATILLVLFVAGDLIGALPGQPAAIALFNQPEAAGVAPEATSIAMMELPAEEALLAETELAMEAAAPPAAADSEGPMAAEPVATLVVEAEAEQGLAMSTEVVVEEFVEVERVADTEEAAATTAERMEGAGPPEMLEAEEGVAEDLEPEFMSVPEAPIETEESIPAGRNIYRLIELALALIAVTTGILALLLRRRHAAG